MASTSLIQHKQNLETYSIIWLDAAVNSFPENVKAQQQLRTSINYLLTFENDNECEEYIQSKPKEDRVIFIVSGQLGTSVVPRIHGLQQIFSIYVYCSDTKKHLQWTQHFSKVNAVIMVLDELIEKISSDQKQRKAKKIDEVISISVLSVSVPDEEQSTSRINGHFIHSQLLIDCLIRMKCSSNEKTELIAFCRKQYEDDKNELKILEEFERNYLPDHALKWYTRDSCLYRLLNKALRIQDVNVLYFFRFFIRDLEQQLENNKCTSPIRVYRGQLMSKDEVTVLKNNKKEFISINSFFSTSLDRELALFFISDFDVSNDLERVFFEIDADPQLENIKPFSDITSQSYFANEKEVLFMIGSVFRLIRVDRNQNGIWMVQMQLCTSNAHQLKPLVEHLRSEYYDEANSLISFGDVLLRMGKFDDAEKYYHLFLDEALLDDKSIARCFHSLGRVATGKDDLDLSLEWFNKSLELKRKISILDDPQVAEIYNSMGITYRKKDELDKSIQMFKKALNIWKKTPGNTSSKVAKCYGGAGNVYQRTKQFSKALTYHQKTLDINETLCPKYHSNMGASHINISAAYRCLRQFDCALEHANLALEIFQKSLPPYHPRIGWVFENIGLVYEQQDKLQQALLYLEKALNIYRHTLHETHYYISDVQENIRRVSSKLQS